MNLIFKESQMYSPEQKMPEKGKPVWLLISQLTDAEEAYFDGNCFRLTQYLFEYEVLPAEVRNWKYCTSEMHI